MSVFWSRALSFIAGVAVLFVITSLDKSLHGQVGGPVDGYIIRTDAHCYRSNCRNSPPGPDEANCGEMGLCKFDMASQSVYMCFPSVDSCYIVTKMGDLNSSIPVQQYCRGYCKANPDDSCKSPAIELCNPTLP